MVFVYSLDGSVCGLKSSHFNASTRVGPESDSRPITRELTRESTRLEPTRDSRVGNILTRTSAVTYFTKFHPPFHLNYSAREL